jgi:hypothetical protein
VNDPTAATERRDESTTASTFPARAAVWARARPELVSSVLVGLAVFIVYEVSREPGVQHLNTYVWQADAFLHGRLHMPDAGAHLDWIFHEGRKYSHQGVLPGVLLMPFVKIWGLGFELRHFAALVGAAIAVVVWHFTRTIGLAGWRRLAGWAFPVLGTTIWFEAKSGTTWGVASLCSVLFLFLALDEYFGARRLHLVGLFVGIAALARGPALLALFGFALAVRDPRKVFRLGLGAALPVLVMVGYNAARFGTITDKALELHYLRDNYRLGRPPGLFSVAHVPSNLHSWLFLGPQFQDAFPWIRPTFYGMAITLTSPGVFSALTARRERWLGLCAGTVVVPAALLYANGFSQFGMRYLLDAIPFLSALILIALKDDTARGYVPLLIASVAINAYGVAVTNTVGLLGP